MVNHVDDPASILQEGATKCLTISHNASVAKQLLHAATCILFILYAATCRKMWLNEAVFVAIRF